VTWSLHSNPRGSEYPSLIRSAALLSLNKCNSFFSIKTLFPKPDGKVWYDGKRDVYKQIFAGDETVDYAFMPQNSDAADNRWLCEAFENNVPLIYFLAISPGRYQAVLRVFIRPGMLFHLWPALHSAYKIPQHLNRSRIQSNVDASYGPSSNSCIKPYSAKPS
jgi:hypothetical protein